ncbi:hypothetical protein [Colwellia sp. Bg11-28]|uniref:hypothetical protein n=1 Tax=Colwellia sp. Bg11-28 TaxID=2058305 RepID=UPI0012FED254|nr:hypothetical protein [Colwellia sp. Bg11-28]
MYKFIFAILMFFATYSHAESVYSIADEISSNTSNHLIFDALTEVEIDSELEYDLSIANIDHNNRILQLTYLSKYSLNNNFPLLNNKFKYLRPRAPPFFII